MRQYASKITELLAVILLVWTVLIAFEVLDPPSYRSLAIAAIGGLSVGLANSCDIRRLMKRVKKS